MEKKNKIKQVTKLYDTCEFCGVPMINCICSRVEKINTEAQIWILSSQKEVIRPTNTARLIKLVNKDSTEIFVWERTVQPDKLIELIEGGDFDVYLLFPADEENKHREKKFEKDNRRTAFIIIDGTWQEARKIFNRSPYLRELPLLTLNLDNESSFKLRRGIPEGGICTIEAAMKVLELNGEHSFAKALEETFELFQRSYKAGASGHKCE